MSGFSRIDHLKGFLQLGFSKGFLFPFFLV